MACQRTDGARQCDERACGNRWASRARAVCVGYLLHPHSKRSDGISKRKWFEPCGCQQLPLSVMDRSERSGKRSLRRIRQQRRKRRIERFERARRSNFCHRREVDLQFERHHLMTISFARGYLDLIVGSCLLGRQKTHR